MILLLCSISIGLFISSLIFFSFFVSRSIYLDFQSHLLLLFIFYSFEEAKNYLLFFVLFFGLLMLIILLPLFVVVIGSQ